MKISVKLKKQAVAFVCLLLLGTAIAFFAPQKNEEKKEIIMIVKIIDDTNDFWSAFVQGAEMAAREYGVNLTIIGPDSETKYEEQGTMIEDSIKKKPAAVVLIPSHYTETQKYAAKIEDAGIPLVVVDSIMEEKMGSCVVATDNVEAGRKMGTYIAENFENISCIGVVGHVKGVSTAVEREQGLREGLGDMEEKIADVVFCDSDYRKAYLVTKEMLTRYPDMNVIAGLNEYSSVGAARAVNDLGLTEKVRMIGFDSSIKEVEYLEDGTFKAIVVQKPLNMGYLSVEKTVELLENEKIPEVVDSGSVLITKETMYTEENQKLLFPF
jgi:ribose transport system substrate-binding protein